MKKPLILYHKNCPDGFGAAFAAWKKFGVKAEYAGIQPSKTADQLAGLVLKDREIYFLDTFVSLPVLVKLRMMNPKVAVVDHHATNESAVRHATEHVFDVKHSGAVLAWQYFHPKKKVPMLLRYLEDGDLWKFRLPHAKTLLPYVYSRPFTFKEYDALMKGMESARERKRYMAAGKTIADYERVLIGEITVKAELVEFKKYKALAVNSVSKRFHSEVGHELVQRRPPLAIVWYIEQEKIKVSLRGNGSVDVGRLAVQFPGGGGHPNAAGFDIPLKQGFPWKWLERKN